MSCPACRRPVSTGEWICPYCDHILDPSVLDKVPLGEGDTFDEPTAALPPRSKKAAEKAVEKAAAPPVWSDSASTGDAPEAMILGDVSVDPEDFRVMPGVGASSDGKTSTFLFYTSGATSRILRPDAVPKLATDSAAASAAPMTPYEDFLLSAIDGKKTVRQIQKESGLAPQEITITLLTLLDKKIIRIAAAPSDAAKERELDERAREQEPPPAHDEFDQDPPSENDFHEIAEPILPPSRPRGRRAAPNELDEPTVDRGDDREEAYERRDERARDQRRDARDSRADLDQPTQSISLAREESPPPVARPREESPILPSDLGSEDAEEVTEYSRAQSARLPAPSSAGSAGVKLFALDEGEPEQENTSAMLEPPPRRAPRTSEPPPPSPRSSVPPPRSSSPAPPRAQRPSDPPRALRSPDAPEKYRPEVRRSDPPPAPSLREDADHRRALTPSPSLIQEPDVEGAVAGALEELAEENRPSFRAAAPMSVPSDEAIDGRDPRARSDNSRPAQKTPHGATPPPLLDPSFLVEVPGTNVGKKPVLRLDAPIFSQTSIPPPVDRGRAGGAGGAASPSAGAAGAGAAAVAAAAAAARRRRAVQEVDRRRGEAAEPAARPEAREPREPREARDAREPREARDAPRDRRGAVKSDAPPPPESKGLSDAVRMAKAAKLFEEALKDKADGNLYSARMNMKLALTFDPNNQLYVEAYQEILKVTPAGTSTSRARELYDQATTAEREDRIDDAIDLLEKALKESKEPAFYNRLGVLLAMKKGEFARAQELIQTAIDLSSGNPTYAHNLGKILQIAASQSVKRQNAGQDKRSVGNLFKGLLGKKK